MSAVAGAAARPAPRAFFEPRFGRDLSQVRVHTGAVAAAYRVGHALLFARDRYDPHSMAGKRLLAHELAHVIQQRSGAPVRAACNGTDPRHTRGRAVTYTELMIP